MLPGQVQPLLYRNRAFVSFDGGLAMVSFAPDISCVTVQLTSCGKESGAAVIDRLRVLLAEELTLYSEVQCGILVPLPGSETTWVDIDVLALEEEDASTRELWRNLIHWYTASCEFAFIRADLLRASTSTTFPRMLTLQELEAHSEFQHWVVRRRISLQGACRGAYRKDFLAVSHRWETSDACDPTGEQLERIRDHLRHHADIQYVFVDYMCLFQGPGRTPEQKATFQVQLPNINLIYLGAAVLILFDCDYSGRFWTQFEAWLSLQGASTSGLTSATTNRTVIECIHGTDEVFGRALRELWSNCRAEEAERILRADSVRVTNSSDKKVQLPKIVVLDRTVRHWMSGQTEERVPAVCAVVEGLTEMLRFSTLQDKHQLATAWCAENGAVCVDDIREYHFIEDFVSALRPMLKIPEMKLRKYLESPSAVSDGCAPAPGELS